MAKIKLNKYSVAMQMYEFFPQMDQLRQVEIEATSPELKNLSNIYWSMQDFVKVC